MSKNTFRGLVALILVVILALGATIAWGVGSRWGEIKNVKDYFNGWGKGISDNSGNNDGEQNGDGDNKDSENNDDDNKVVTTSLLSLEITPYTSEEGICQTFIEDEASPYDVVTYSSSDVCTLTATVKAEDGVPYPSLQKVTFSMGWADESNSNFVVTDYVKMTVNGCIASFECLQPFAYQILVTCTSSIDPNISNTCNINYAKRIDRMYCFIETMGENPGTVTSSKGSDGKLDISYKLQYASDYSEIELCSGVFYDYYYGNVYDEITSCSITITPTDEFIYHLASSHGANEQPFNTSKITSYTYEYTLGEVTTVTLGECLPVLSNPTIVSIFENTLGISGSAWSQFGNRINNVTFSCDRDFYVEIQLEGKYSGTKYMRYYLNFATDIGSISFDNPSITF